MKLPTQRVARLLRAEEGRGELLPVLSKRMGTNLDPGGTHEPSRWLLRCDGKERQPQPLGPAIKPTSSVQEVRLALDDHPVVQDWQVAHWDGRQARRVGDQEAQDGAGQPARVGRGGDTRGHCAAPRSPLPHQGQATTAPAVEV